MSEEIRPLTPQELAEAREKWVVRGRYYLAQCEKCGYTGTSEGFDSDGEDIRCPRCHQDRVAEVSQDSYPVAALIATIDQLTGIGFEGLDEVKQLRINVDRLWRERDEETQRAERAETTLNATENSARMLRAMVLQLGEQFTAACNQRDEALAAKDRAERLLDEAEAERDKALEEVDVQKGKWKGEYARGKAAHERAKQLDEAIAAKERAEAERDEAREIAEAATHRAETQCRRAESAEAIADARGRALATLKDSVITMRVTPYGDHDETLDTMLDLINVADDASTPEALRQQQEREAAGKEFAEILKEFHEEGIAVLDDRVKALVGSLLGLAVEDGPFDPLPSLAALDAAKKGER